MVVKKEGMQQKTKHKNKAQQKEKRFDGEREQRNRKIREISA